MQPIKRDEVKHFIDAGLDVAIIEALPKSAYETGHLPGALSMPLETLAKEAPQQLPDKAQKIITYCQSADCAASTKAAEILEGLGYTDVSDYVEGKDDWKAAGYKMEGAPKEYDEGLPPDSMEEGHGIANAVSGRTIEDLESLAADYQKDFRSSAGDTDYSLDHQSGREI